MQEEVLPADPLPVFPYCSLAMLCYTHQVMMSFVRGLAEGLRPKHPERGGGGVSSIDESVTSMASALVADFAQREGVSLTQEEIAGLLVEAQFEARQALANALLHDADPSPLSEPLYAAIVHDQIKIAGLAATHLPVDQNERTEYLRLSDAFRRTLRGHKREQVDRFEDDEE